MTILLLAAGLGTRLRPITEKIPKPCLKVAGRPLLHWSVDPILSTMQPEKLIVNTHYLPHLVKETASTLSLQNTELIFSDEQPQILGSGGAIVHAYKKLSNSTDFLLANADVIFFPDKKHILNILKNKHLSDNNLATLLVMDHKGVGTQFSGVWSTNKQDIMGFGKTPPTEKSVAYHYTGYMMLSQRISEYLPQQGPSHVFRDGLIPAIQKNERVQYVHCSGQWFETGNKKDFDHAHRHISKVKNLKNK